MRTFSGFFLVGVLLVGCHACMIAVVKDKQTALRLQGIIIRELQFNDAPIENALEYLANNTHCVCHPWRKTEHEIQGDYVVFQLHVPELHEPPDSKANFVNNISKNPLPPLPSVTLSAKNISVLEAFRRVAVITDSTYQVQKDIVIVRTHRMEQQPNKEVRPIPVDPF